MADADKPAATGSGEPKWTPEGRFTLGEEGECYFAPTPPASQQAREKLEEAMSYSGDRWEEWGERALHVSELLDDVLALLRAAEQK